MNIKVINPIEYSGWNELLLSNENYSFFHTSGWAKVISESYNYEPLYFAKIDNSELTELIPIMSIKSFLTGRRGVSLPFTDYCPIITFKRDHLKELFKAITKYGEKTKWKTIEFRSNGINLLDKTSSLYYYRHELKLEKNYQEIIAKFRKSTKRNIKKAIKEGVKVKMFNTLESVIKFYRLNTLTRRYHGLPPQPYSFFKKLYEHIISVKKGFVALAFYQNKVIAGNIYLCFGKKAIYKYGASKRSYQHLRANNLIMWESIKWLAENEFDSLCFGITDPKNQGLLQFKRGWNTREEAVSYYKYNIVKDCFVTEKPRFNLSYNSFRYMPTPILQIAGKILYRHVG